MELQKLWSFLAVGTGGFVGSAGRYAITLLMAGASERTAFPVGTLTANLVGSFVIGLFGAWMAADALPQPMRLLFVVGLLGGFTTFSSFSLETFQLFSQGRLLHGLLYSLGQLASGLGLAAVGFALGRRFVGG